MNTNRKKRHQRYQLLRSYWKKEAVCPGLPLSAIISSTSRCNLKCPMCPRAISEFKNQDMDFDLFTRIVDEGAPYFEFVIPQGGGEPMLNPRIFDMVRYCKGRNLRVGFSTNATLLRGDRIEETLDSGLDYLIIAFDGTTPETYEKYRQGARFEETRANILNFLERKVARRSPIVVTLQMVRLPDNQHQIGDFRRMWHLPGVNDIRIKEDEIGVEGVCLAEKKEPPEFLNPCHFLWQGPIYIEENGDVFPCCHAWEAKPLGNVREQKLVEIWNNERMQAMRRAHVSGELRGLPECLACKAARPRLPLILGSFMVDSFRVRKLIPLVEKLNLLYRIALFENRHTHGSLPPK